MLLCVWLPACKKEAVPPKPSEPPAAVVEKPVPEPPPTEAKTRFPEGFEQLAPEAKEVWLKAEVKPKIPKDLDKHPAAKQAHWLEMLVALEKRQRLMAPDEALAKIQSAKVRRECIRPAPRGFKPKNARWKIKLTLTPERKTIRIGERFSYRLEIQNIGREPVLFAESPSQFLTGTVQRPYTFVVILPDGKKKLLTHAEGSDVGEVFIELPGEEHMTNDERDAALRKMALEERHRDELVVHLQSGETLVSKDPDGPPGSFRELHTNFKYKVPGTYRIKAHYDDPPPTPPDEEEIQRRIKRRVDRESQMKAYREHVKKALGRVTSNEVSFEVVP